MDPMKKQKTKDAVVSFAPIMVKEGQRALVTAMPQEIFKGNRLVIPSGTARFFLIHDFKVGLNSQLSSAGSIPASAFDEHAIGTFLEFDTAYPGHMIILDVEHVKVQRPNFIVRFIRRLLGTEQDWALEHNFTAMLCGKSIDYYAEPAEEVPQEPPVN